MRLPRPIEMAVPVVCAFLLGAVAMLYPLGSSAAEGLKLPPAEYKPLPVGTKVNYDTWEYIVKRSDGFKTVVQTSKTIDWITTVFSYQGGVGLHFDYKENTSLGLGYRFFGSSDAKFDDGTRKVEAEYSSHIISVGLVHRF